eukprot:NODE_9848_length_1395_cov_1.345426.p1 GENE.NODE_9848_length_1395_cov_1.345426~~NODE_9848_length_1395_cov_1.345426.p1  ORF type:complete len:414 (+),score=152.47 NODE_9848_length_1395_cov_1.345426:50-1243(+)
MALFYRRVHHGEPYDAYAMVALMPTPVGTVVPSTPAWPPEEAQALAAALGSFSGDTCALCVAASPPAGSSGGVAAAGSTPTPAATAPTAEAAAAAAPEAAAAAAPAARAVAGDALATIVILDTALPLLRCACYRPALVDGLVASVGGITEYTSKAARQPMLRQLREDGEALTDAVGGDLVALLERSNAASDSAQNTRRVLLPLLNTLGTLLVHGLFPEGRARMLLAQVHGVLQRVREVSRQRAAVSVLIGLLQWRGMPRRGAMRLLLEILGGAVPCVRMSAAQELYVRLLQEVDGLDLANDAVEGAADGVPAEVASAEDVERVQELLASCAWGVEDGSARAQALCEIYEKLHLTAPTASGEAALLPGLSEEGGAAAAAPRRRAPVSGYAEFVRDYYN